MDLSGVLQWSVWRMNKVRWSTLASCRMFDGGLWFFPLATGWNAYTDFPISCIGHKSWHNHDNVSIHPIHFGSLFQTPIRVTTVTILTLPYPGVWIVAKSVFQESGEYGITWNIKNTPHNLLIERMSYWSTLTNVSKTNADIGINEQPKTTVRQSNQEPRKNTIRYPSAVDIPDVATITSRIEASLLTD